MDAFTVSLGIGTSENARDRRSKFRLAFHFGLFQAGMTALGWVGGSTIERYIRQIDHWVAFALLAFVGTRMVISGLNAERVTYHTDPSRGGILVMLSFATSMDALAVGLSMAMIKQPILLPALIIGVVTYGLSMVGLIWGNQLGQRFGKRMEILGGLILISIGLRVLLSHLLGM